MNSLDKMKQDSDIRLQTLSQWLINEPSADIYRFSTLSSLPGCLNEAVGMLADESRLKIYGLKFLCASCIKDAQLLVSLRLVNRSSITIKAI